MGKTSNKMYISRTEWTTEFGGAKANSKQTSTSFKRLPFYCCSISLRTASTPVCTPEGIVYDLVHLLPWLKKHGTDPVTSKPLSSDDLIHLHLHKSTNGEYHCPVSLKVFTENSKIVTIKSTGNVFSYDVVQELCIKPKTLRDLITDESFTKKDLIILQDPLHLDKHNIAHFDYVKKNIRIPVVETKASVNKQASSTVGKILDKLESSETSEFKEAMKSLKRKHD